VAVVSALDGRCSKHRLVVFDKKSLLSKGLSRLQFQEFDEHRYLIALHNNDMRVDLLLLLLQSVKSSALKLKQRLSLKICWSGHT
jgi:hypothetical protein